MWAQGQSAENETIGSRDERFTMAGTWITQALKNPTVLRCSFCRKATSLYQLKRLYVSMTSWKWAEFARNELLAVQSRPNEIASFIWFSHSSSQGRSSLSDAAVWRYYLRQEPNEVIPHVRICGGAPGDRRSYRDESFEVLITV